MTSETPGISLQRMDEAILPSLSMILDSLLDAASLARPGADANAYADSLRGLALELDSLVRQVELACAAADRGAEPPRYSAASAA